MERLVNNCDKSGCVLTLPRVAKLCGLADCCSDAAHRSTSKCGHRAPRSHSCSCRGVESSRSKADDERVVRRLSEGVPGILTRHFQLPENTPHKNKGPNTPKTESQQRPCKKTQETPKTKQDASKSNRIARTQHRMHV